MGWLLLEYSHRLGKGCHRPSSERAVIGYRRAGAWYGMAAIIR